MAIATAEPAAKNVRWWPSTNPINSVKGLVLGGFAVLVLILIAVVAGSAWLVREHQANLAEMEHHTVMADLLQETQADLGTSAGFLFGYITTGNELLLPTINDALTSSLLSINQAAALDKQGYSNVANLTYIQTERTKLNDATTEMLRLMKDGKQQEAMLLIQQTAPPYQMWVVQVNTAIESEQLEVAALRKNADHAGNLAFWLLVISGALGAGIGLAASVLIARSILKPLSSLEATARAVAKGDLDARAPAAGPRELAHLGETMNYMMNTIQEHTEEIQERGRQLRDARAQAASDPLTGLGNHRKFHEKIRDTVVAAQENGAPVGLIMLDVDNFKGVNDTLGHQAGDQVLRDLSATIAEVAGDDQGYRYGGDEFVILLPDHDGPRAAEVAERLLHAVATQVVNADKITVSLGVAAFPDMAASAQELIYRADMTMNWAKSAGKNRLGVWDTALGDKRDAVSQT